MTEDVAVREHLEVVVQRARSVGRLDELSKLIGEIYANNLRRLEPKLGDDLLVLGQQCHRNLLNLAKQFGQVNDVDIDGAQTLELRLAGKIWHTGKVTSRDPAWTPDRIKWDGSDVRINAARANTQTFFSSEETLFASLSDGPFSSHEADPDDLRFLHIAWQGLGEEGVRVFVGFPQLGARPWLAVTEITVGRPGTGGVPKPADDSVRRSPNHDAMAEPKVAVKRRPTAGREAPPSTGEVS